MTWRRCPFRCPPLPRSPDPHAPSGSGPPSSRVHRGPSAGLWDNTLVHPHMQEGAWKKGHHLAALNNLGPRENPSFGEMLVTSSQRYGTTTPIIQSYDQNWLEVMGLQLLAPGGSWLGKAVLSNYSCSPRKCVIHKQLHNSTKSAQANWWTFKTLSECTHHPPPTPACRRSPKAKV